MPLTLYVPVHTGGAGEVADGQGSQADLYNPEKTTGNKPEVHEAPCKPGVHAKMSATVRGRRKIMWALAGAAGIGVAVLMSRCMPASRR